MRHPALKSVVVTVVSLVVLTGLAACSSAPEPSPTSSDGASQPTGGVPTDISSVGESADPQRLGQDVRAAMSELTSYRMEIVSQSQAADKVMESTTSLSVDHSDPAVLKVKSTSVTEGSEIVMIQVGPDVYTLLPGATQYTKSSAQGSEVPAAGGVEQLFTDAQQVRFVGDEQLDGEPVRHYLLLDTGATIDVFVDADNHVVKSVTTTQPSGASGEPTSAIGRSTVEITWHDFNQPMGIQAPEPSQVQG